MILKILSYNIHKGFDWKNQKYFIHEMKEFIKSSEADIVFLQEVVGKNLKYAQSGLVDSQFEFLADELWPHFSYGRNAVYDHGHHGNLILSKFPIESFENVDISTNSWEKRGLLICKIKLPELNNQFFYTACSHLNLFHAGRVLQYQLIKNEILKRQEDQIPFIVAGDFNDWNKKGSQVFEKELEMRDVHKATYSKYAKTFPAIYPMLCLDRIYVKNVKINKVLILETQTFHRSLGHLSDHLPLYCEVEVYAT